MAALDFGWYHTNVDPVPAVVWFELDASGNRLEDQSADGDRVDVIMLGWDAGKRSNVPMYDEGDEELSKNSFERVGA